MSSINQNAGGMPKLRLALHYTSLGDLPITVVVSATLA
jgi:hypothetical protein